MALDIYCLDADGSLFDVALLSAVAGFSHCEIVTIFWLLLIAFANHLYFTEPLISYISILFLMLLKFDCLVVQIPVVSVSDERRIVLVPEGNNYILADPTSEEESIMETQLTVVLDSSGLLV
ncbi:OLC1v1004155C1 [Oldenlandia corymbosa var. corymbosa]|uniref:OLC1v1004155C1 n=1 Tax=Oldenlandia corymbosa var. corymbosa TaxID=529605 RepID=A0AAV1DEB7_OLDCO|nr:OLC1v1004155C1 [Oldenlandia corymbosa var. corymbosa]